MSEQIFVYRGANFGGKSKLKGSYSQRRRFFAESITCRALDKADFETNRLKFRYSWYEVVRVHAYPPGYHTLSFSCLTRDGAREKQTPLVGVEGFLGGLVEKRMEMSLSDV